MPYGGLPASLKIPGFTPNWDEIIKADPGFMAKQAQLAAARGSARGNTLAGIRQRLISFGVLPQSIGNTVPDPLVTEALDPLTRQLIDQSTSSGVSESGRLASANRQAQRTLRNQFAARGILPSVDPAAARQQGEYEQQSYEQVQNVLGFLRDLLGGYGSSLGDLSAQEQQAYQDAYAAQVGLPQNQPTADIDLNHIQGTRGYYRGTDGQLYNQQKQPIDARKAYEHYTRQIAAMKRAGIPERQIRNGWQYKRWVALSKFV